MDSTIFFIGDPVYKFLPKTRVKTLICIKKKGILHDCYTCHSLLFT